MNAQVATLRPVPARITAALDIAGLYGPQVDIDLGGAEPMVDDWEAGKYPPTTEQVARLAKLTGFSIAYFYHPVQDWERTPHQTYLCQRGRRGDNGLTIIESHIDPDGVLHRREVTPQRPPYRPARKPVDVGHAAGIPVPPAQPDCVCSHFHASHLIGRRQGVMARTRCGTADPQPCGCRLYQPREA